MAVNFTFGQDISNTVGRTLERDAIAQQQARQLQRLVERDAFNREIQSLAARMDQKRFQFEQEKFAANQVADALDREQERAEFERQQTLDSVNIARQQERDALSKKQIEANIRNIDSLIKNRGQDGGPGSDRSQTAALTLLQNLAPQTRDMAKDVFAAESAYLQAKKAFEQAPEDDKEFFRNEMNNAARLMAATMKRSEGVTDVINKVNKRLGLDIDMGEILSTVEVPTQQGTPQPEAQSQVDPLQPQPQSQSNEGFLSFPESGWGKLAETLGIQSPSAPLDNL